MKFLPTGLADAWVVEQAPFVDDRGQFARLFCEAEFAAQGLEGHFAQINESFNLAEATMRGMHLQMTPCAEVKLVRCLSGALWDCIIDLRPTSLTYGRWYGATLTPENRQMMYVPKGFAHGFVTLKPATLALYLSSTPYSPGHERGFRHDDPAFAIDWPVKPVVVSEKDRNWADFRDEHVTELAQL